MLNRRALIVSTVMVLAYASGAQAVDIEMVTVGNAGNAGEWSGQSYGGYGPDRFCGVVDYSCRMGKYEVTAAQYTEFLNAVALTDTYGLYTSDMWASEYGCKIERSGASGGYSYSVAPAYANRPVNGISWGDAARFANWMHNRQPTGGQGPGTTETGSYGLNGSMTRAELLAVTRDPDATWVIPSEDEWYKAAYHKNDGVTSNYYDYPTISDSIPISEGCPGGSNSANYADGGATYAIGPPFYRNDVGCYVSSYSPYGAFDMGGNVWEWNESVINNSVRGLRGGSLFNADAAMRATDRADHGDPVAESFYVLSRGIGFRLALATPALQQPIPTLSAWGVTAMTLLLMTAITIVFSRQRKPSLGWGH